MHFRVSRFFGITSYLFVRVFRFNINDEFIAIEESDKVLGR